MPETEQNQLFYEDVADAVRRDMATAGIGHKELSCIVWPGKKPEVASSLLSRALNSDNTDVNLSVEAMLAIMKATGGVNIINFLCDEFMFDRPVKKARRNFEREIRDKVKDVENLLASLTYSIQQMGRMPEDGGGE